MYSTLRNRIGKAIFKIGVNRRNPSYYKVLKELVDTDYSSKEVLENIQFNKLRSLLMFVYEHNEYYRHKFESVGFEPSTDFKKIEDIVKVPLLTKNDLFSNDIHSQGAFGKGFYSETSGSTGQPLVFYKDELWDSYNRASIHRGMLWHDVSPWEYNGYFWGYSFSKLKKFKMKFLDLCMNRFRVFTYNPTTLSRFLKQAYNASYLHGYSSMLYEAAKYVNSSDDCYQFPRLKIGKATSEKIHDHYRSEFESAFGVKLVSEYGAAESGIIGFECQHCNMHINEETCYVEVIDDEIVVTNLVARSFPTIRYKLGDYVKVLDSDCKCGKKHRIIKDVLGRVGTSIYGSEGAKYPSLTLYYVFKNLVIEHNLRIDYRVEQHRVGHLDLLIQDQLTETELDKVLNMFNAYFDSSIEVNVKRVNNLHPIDKKLKDFESFLNL